MVMVSFHSVIFTDRFTIILEGNCCGNEITSGELEILSLMPDTPPPRPH
jgi:hypothetical protein